MKNTSKPIIFFGTEDLSLHFLEALVNAKFNVSAVVTKPDSKKGRGQKLTPPAVKTFAIEHNITVWQPTKLSDIKSKIVDLGDVAGVLVSFGKIIPNSILDLFNPGIINVHPSLLPKYRGPSPVETAIKNGDPITGISIMKLESKMDAGPIYCKTEFPILPCDTSLTLYEKVKDAGTHLLIDILPNILDGSATSLPQDETKASYCSILLKQDSEIDTAEISATEAERLIRAYFIYPKSTVTVGDHRIIITKSHVQSTGETPLDLRCKDGLYLSVDELIAPSGKKMTASEFLRGYRLAR